jgi:polysaccharide pyruvyl transferase WcaK-like protein
MKILLQGYYGFGNLGDDILLKVTYDFVRNIFPQAEIMIFSNNSTNGNKYLKKIIHHDVTILNYASREHVDCIIHGGGGVHYDFNRGRGRFSILNTVIKIIGIENYCSLYGVLRKLRNKGNITTPFRVGIGIGVGTFTNSSEKFYTSISILGSYNYLLVRDSSSVLKARLYNKKTTLKQSVDLAFMKDSWTTLRRNATEGRRIGVVLRDWRQERSHIDSMKRMTRLWIKMGYHVSYFFFEKDQDASLRNSLKGLSNHITWDPHEQHFEDFFARFSEQDIIISSRFHGALLAAAFGIPSLCLAVEPKLQTVPEMLPSAKMVTLPIDEQELSQLVEETFSNLTWLHEAVLKEFGQNYQRIQSDLNEVEKVLRSYAQSTKTST